MTTPANPFALDTPAPPAAPAAQPAPTPAAAPAAPPLTPAAPPPAAPAAPEADPFDGPAPQSSRPRVRDMYNRLVLIRPHRLEEGLPNRLEPGKTQDRMTADVIVLDGGPLHYGGAPEKIPAVPHDKTAPVPFKVDRMYLSQAGLISQSRQALAKRLRGEPGMVLGRLTTGEAKGDASPPWLLTQPTEAEKQIARTYLATVDPFA